MHSTEERESRLHYMDFEATEVLQFSTAPCQIISMKSYKSTGKVELCIYF